MALQVTESQNTKVYLIPAGTTLTDAASIKTAISTGIDGRARGIKGCWIVLTERDEDGRILSVLSFEVDGEKVKENTLYTLRNGQLEEVI